MFGGLPEHLLEGIFGEKLTRGAIIRFFLGPEVIKDPNWPDGKDKFGIVLNAICPEPEILYALTTSKDSSGLKRFENVIIRVPKGTYDCFPLPTIISFREMGAIPLDKLKEQYRTGKMQFCGRLTDEHVERMNLAIKINFSPRDKARILPA